MWSSRTSSETREVTSNEEVTQVATISADGGTEIGRLIADAFDRIGSEGVITVGDAKSLETELRWLNGCIRSWLHLALFHYQCQKMLVELEDPHMLICKKKLSGLQEFLPLLERA